MSVESLTVELNRVKQLRNEISILYKELNIYLEEETDKLTIALLDKGVCPRCGGLVASEKYDKPKPLNFTVNTSLLDNGIVYRCKDCDYTRYISNDTYTKLKEAPL